MSRAKIVPFPQVAAAPDPASVPSLMDVGVSGEAALSPVTTVVITPGEGWVPHLSTRYPSAFASFARWVTAERVGDELTVR